MPAAVSVLFLGDRRRAEFAAALAALAACADMQFAESAGAAVKMLLAESEAIPELIVLAQAWPGCFSAEQIDRLRRAAPLARVVELLGSWCDGEVRSGAPLPATIRVPWPRFEIWLRGEIARRAQGLPPDWARPVTATDEDRLLACDTSEPPGAGLIVIRGGDHASADWLAAAARGRGYATTIMDRSSLHPPLRIPHATAGIWESDSLDAAAARELRAFAAAIAPAPVVCVLGFPRLKEIERASAAGATCVLPKPLLQSELFSALSIPQRGCGHGR